MSEKISPNEVIDDLIRYIEDTPATGKLKALIISFVKSAFDKYPYGAQTRPVLQDAEQEELVAIRSWLVEMVYRAVEATIKATPGAEATPEARKLAMMYLNIWKNAKNKVTAS